MRCQRTKLRGTRGVRHASGPAIPAPDGGRNPAPPVEARWFRTLKPPFVCPGERPADSQPLTHRPRHATRRSVTSPLAALVPFVLPAGRPRLHVLEVARLPVGAAAIGCVVVAGFGVAPGDCCDSRLAAIQHACDGLRPASGSTCTIARWGPPVEPGGAPGSPGTPDTGCGHRRHLAPMATMAAPTEHREGATLGIRK